MKQRILMAQEAQMIEQNQQTLNRLASIEIILKELLNMLKSLQIMRKHVLG